MSLREIVENKLLPYVEKPGRYSGGELNSIVKDLSSVAVNGVLCFPELYDIGMSHYGSQILYRIVNDRPQWALARSYAPWLDAEKVMRREDIPLYSLEYMQPLIDADWLGFSMQYELQFTNMINMLDLAGIPMRSVDRTDEHPLIIAGGPIVANSEPIADFVDVVFLGDGEDAIVEMCERIEKAKADGLTRAELLKSFQEMPNAYVPSLYETEEIYGLTVPIFEKPVRAAKIAEITEEMTPMKQIVPLIDVVHDRMAVEVMRGCTKGCRFCSAGMYYRPVRERKVESIEEQISCGVKDTGWNEIGLLSLSTADYSSFSDLLSVSARGMIDDDIKVGLPSTRIDAITEKEFQLLDKVSSGSSLTIAPEAGSQRLRNVINKDFSRETIIEMVQKLLKNNLSTLKLYLMVGLPTENDADIDELIELVKEISDMLWASSKSRNLNVSLSPFSPKPHTPFQWFGFAGKEVILERCKKIKGFFKNVRNVKIDYRNPQVSYLESVLTRGDRKLSAVIEKAWAEGARFDGWQEMFNIQLWQESAEAAGVDLDLYVQEHPVDRKLPWAVTSMLFSETFLRLEYEKSLKEVVTQDCREGCIACGVCGKGISMKYAEPYRVTPVEEVTEALAEKKKHSITGEKVLYRVKYFKGESARFLSHQNSVNILHRAFKAAGINVAYTNGFRARPRFSFGPPLPQATYGEGEFFDVTLFDTGEELNLEPVAQYLPEGIRLLGSAKITKKTQALNAAITGAKWRMTPIANVTMDEIKEAIDTFEKAETLTIERVRKEKVKYVDIKSLVQALAITKDGLEVVLLAEPGNSCKPLEFIGALFPEKSFYDFAVCRAICLTKDQKGNFIPL